MFRCRRCGHATVSWRTLRQHQLNNHQSGRGDFQQPEWVEVHQQGFQDVYRQHIPSINLPHNDPAGAVRTYNYPLTDSGDLMQQIHTRINDIYAIQLHAFRFNLSLGLILHNVEDERYRFFHPYYNTDIFPTPLLIQKYGIFMLFSRGVYRL